MVNVGVGSTESIDVFDEGIFRDMIVETVFIAWVGSTKLLVKVEKKGINLRLCKDTKSRVTFQTAINFRLRKDTKLRVTFQTVINSDTFFSKLNKTFY